MAKFKIDDAVTVWRGKYKGREGRILAIDPNATDKDLAVILGHEGQTVVEVGDLSKHFKDGTNSCARNAIKVGDTVTYKLDAPGNKGKKYIVLEEGRTGYVWLADMDGRGNGMEVKRADLVAANSCRSTNAVVAKALNATRVARNGSIMFELAKKYIEKNDDFGGVIDILKQDENLMPNYAPSLWAGAMAKAKRYYDAGNKATPEQKKELVSMIAHLIANSRASSNACGTARNAWGDEAQVNGLITKMVGLIKQIKPIARQLYDTAFELDDAGSVWLGQNQGSKNAQKVKVAVDRANKVMSRLANFTSGLD